MIRKLARRLAAVLVVLLLAILGTGIYLLHRVDRHWVAAQLEKSLERKVLIGGMKVNLFSGMGGFVLRDVTVSRRLSPQRRATMQSVPDKWLLLRAGEGRISIRWAPLLRRRLEIATLSLEKPDLRLERRADGGTNLDDLLSSGSGDSRTLQRVSLEGFSIHGGRVDWLDLAGGARYVISNLVFNARRQREGKAHSVVSSFGIRSERMGRAPLARKVDMDLRVKGRVRIGSPDIAALEYSMRVELPRGRIEGVTLLRRLWSMPAVKDLLGAAMNPGEDITWQKGALTLSGLGTRLEISDGLIRTGEYSLEYGGTWNLENDGVKLDLAFRFPQARVPELRKDLTRRIGPLVPAFLRAAAPPDRLAERILALLLDDRGRPRLDVRVSGTIGSPKVRLVRPGMDSLGRAVTEMLKEEAARKGAGLLRSLVER